MLNALVVTTGRERVFFFPSQGSVGESGMGEIHSHFLRAAKGFKVHSHNRRQNAGSSIYIYFSIQLFAFQSQHLNYLVDYMCPKLNVNVVLCAHEEETVPDTCLLFSSHLWEMV